MSIAIVVNKALRRAGHALVTGGRAFLRSRRGNVAMIFALTAIPVIIAGGAGIDLARTLAARNALQSALDAAALAVATSTPPPDTLSQAQLDTIAQNYFNANYKLSTSDFGAPSAVHAVLSSDKSSVTVNTTNNVPTTLMRIALINSVPLTAASTVTWGQTKLWVALVLDNTGSMCQSETNPNAGSPCPTPNSGSKITALKTATHQLLDMLQGAAAHDGDIQVSLSPFVKDVNVGSSNYNASWIYWGNAAQDPNQTDNSSWDAQNGTCSISNKSPRSVCKANGTCSISGYSSQSTCQAATTGTCSVSGLTSQSSCTSGGSCSVNPNTNTSQSACNSAGTCSISGYASQSSCQAANTGVCSISTYSGTNSSTCTSHGTCSISGYTTQSTCQAATTGSCNIGGGSYTTQSQCTSNGVCSNAAKTSQNSCTNQKACSKSAYTNQSQCTSNGGVWGFGTWSWGIWTTASHGVWTPGVWTPGVSGVWTPGVWTAGVWTITGYGVWTWGVWTPNNHSTWNGYVTDRGYPDSPDYLTLGLLNMSGPDTANNYDTNNSTPVSGAPSSLFPAEQYIPCSTCSPLQQVLPLGHDWTALSNKVDAMTAGGNTNQTIGFAWGWHSLSDGDPLNPGTLPANTTPIIILMSDGLNTQNRWSSTASSIDNRLSAACSNFKNWQYDSSNTSLRPIIYTVQVDTSGDGVSSVLQNCATGGALGGKYYHLTTAGATIAAFNAIGQQITNMRVAH